MKQPFAAATLLVTLVVTPAGAVCTAAEPQAVDTAAAREAVKARFEGHPVIEAALWSSDRLFNVGVHYMGAAENSLAREICLVLAEHGLDRDTRVQVIDINTMGTDPQRWERVGEAACR